MRSNETGRRHITDDCFAAVVRAFMNSPKFTGDTWSDATKRLWGRYLLVAARPDYLGAVSICDLRPSLVQGVMDGFTGQTGVQASMLAALKQLEKWAIVRDILPRPITTGVEIEESDDGHTPWSDEDVALVERHGRADFARMATLGGNTGQRRSDLIRIGPTDIEVYQGVRGINVTQQKTGRKVWVPITSHLADVMATWKREPGPFLKKMDGRPWSGDQLYTAWIRHRNSNPQLALLKAKGLVIHGLRGHACVRLLRAGANTRQIADMVGMSEPMVKSYTRFSDQRENATAALYHLERAARERPVDKLRYNHG